MFPIMWQVYFQEAMRDSNWFQIVKRRISKNIGFICIVIESLVCGVPMSSGKDVMDGYKSQSDAG